MAKVDNAPKAANQEEAISLASLQYAASGVSELATMLSEAATLTNSSDPREAASGWERIRLLSAIKGAIEAGSEPTDFDKRITALEKAKAAKPATVDLSNVNKAIGDLTTALNALITRVENLETAKG